MPLLRLIYILILIDYSLSAYALTFAIDKNSDIIGNIQVTTVQTGESLGEIGRKFGLGVYEMIEANPNLSPWEPKVGAAVIVPTEFILPRGKRQGIVINLAEMRIYYFHPNQKLVTTYPVGIGKRGWGTPLGYGSITQKTPNPCWNPPQSIREANAKRGHVLPKVVPPGPANPLGKYAMRLSIPGYLIHGTNRPGGVGVRSSSGCIRMFPEDISEFFPQVAVGTPIRIIHAPCKFGKRGNNIFVEVHIPLSDPCYQKVDSLADIKDELGEFFTAKERSQIDLDHVQRVIFEPRGYPVLLNY